jgi:hypothetical protein
MVETLVAPMSRIVRAQCEKELSLRPSGISICERRQEIANFRDGRIAGSNQPPRNLGIARFVFGRHFVQKGSLERTLQNLLQIGSLSLHEKQPKGSLLMGAWDILPWDNDGAADWFGDLFERTKLAKHVEDALQLKPENSYEEIRAAASILIFLGRPYIWPIYDLDRHLTLAADRLEQVARVDEIAESSEFVEQIQAEIEELRSRIKKPGVLPPPPKPVEKKWWRFWK